jgi:hypothetical protein
MGRLLGWKLRKHGVRPTRANIMGHRDVGETSCPGAALHRQVRTIETVAVEGNPPPGPFYDVPWTNPRARAIDWVDRERIIPGFPDARFRPGLEASRADAAVWLWRLAGSPPGGSEPFTDVATNAPYREAVAWGYGNGVLRGISATRFAPGRDMARRALLANLWRYLGEPAVAVPHPFTDADPRPSLDWAAEFGLVGGTTLRPTSPIVRGVAADLLYRIRPFTDVGRRQVARASVDWARAHVIVSGYRNHTFRPGLSVTRAQATNWIWRFLDQPVAGPGDPSPGADPLDRATAVTWLWEAAGSPDAGSAADWAAAHGLFPGLSAPDFGAQLVTRAELVRALYRLAARPAAWATDPPGTVRF